MVFSIVWRGSTTSNSARHTRFREPLRVDVCREFAGKRAGANGGTAQPASKPGLAAVAPMPHHGKSRGNKDVEAENRY
ncbi:hypothetical protein [Paeniglutamicibacter psychrophenolicus]|uniref:Uncharacterized protein n=1 Tax=Paeniglutamicibacter psychrophenolicus TaxID=257454 RepID=A0ABS4WAX9_9MICC|nr:hypothetical protein [Paeniglutamicibacter psychrophenolicus]MBP2373365.1 hypothetical protein [Paeniglutamicibacter psychrophenolicus]